MTKTAARKLESVEKKDRWKEFLQSTQLWAYVVPKTTDRSTQYIWVMMPKDLDVICLEQYQNRDVFIQYGIPRSGIPSQIYTTIVAPTSHANENRLFGLPMSSLAETCFGLMNLKRKVHTEGQTPESFDLHYIFTAIMEIHKAPKSDWVLPFVTR